MSATPGGPVLRRGAPLGRYVVRRLLGAGGNGTVYEAYDPELDRKVAVKRVRGDFLDSKVRLQARRQLRLEAQAIARLAHPNVVRVYDVGLVDDDLFVAMERIDGPTLCQWLAAAPRSWREVVKVLCDVGEGLAAAHSVGLVHRDVKPSNVMLADGRRAVVLDFGLARAVETQEPVTGQPGEASGTVAGCGTPAYMAPEQRHGQTVDARADQFSFCVMLYEALCGEHPFSGDDAGAVEVDGTGAPRPLPPGPGLPARLKRILARGLATDPDERFPTMHELLDELGGLLRRRRGRLLGLAAAVITGLLVAGGQWAGVSTPAPCADPGRALGDVWSGEQQRRLRAAFLASPLPDGRDAWRRAAERIDAYTGRWTENRRQACEATRLHGEQSAELMDLRMACLDRHRRQLGAVIGLLAEGEPAVLAQADRLTAGLRSLADCQDAQRLLSAPARPADAGSRRRMGEAEQLLARARAVEVTGRYPEALALSVEALEAAERAGYPPLVAEARIRVAIAHGRTGDLERYRQGLLEAAGYAQAHRAGAEVAVAFTYLLLSSVERGELREAEQWNLLAQGAIEGFGDIPELDAFRRFCLGELYLELSRFEEAQAELEAYIDIHPDPGPLEKGFAELYQARALMGLGRLQEAAHRLDAAQESLLAAGGPDSGGMGSLYQLRGDLELRRGRTAVAETHYRRALAGFLDDGVPDNLQSAPALLGLGRSLLEQDRAAEARMLLERATGASQGGDPVDLAASRYHLARALWQLGETGRAQEEAAQAHRLLAAAGERATEQLAELEDWMSRRGLAA